MSQTCTWFTGWLSDALAIRCTAPVMVAPLPGVEMTTLLLGLVGPEFAKKSAMGAADAPSPGQGFRPMAAHTVAKTFSL